MRLGHGGIYALGPVVDAEPLPNTLRSCRSQGPTIGRKRMHAAPPTNVCFGGKANAFQRPEKARGSHAKR